MELINEFAESEVIRADDLSLSDDIEEVKSRVFSLLSGKIESLRNTGTEEEFAEFERRLTLAAIDELWMNHIDSMAHLREEVAFEWYAQKNPLIIYKEKAYEKFVILIDTIGVRVIKWLLTAKPHEAIDEVNFEESLLEKYADNALEGFDQSIALSAGHMGHTDYTPEPMTEAESGIRIIKKESAQESEKTQYTWVWRNDPCPCWSWKKFKQCHGK